jgi:nitrate reductase NapE
MHSPTGSGSDALQRESVNENAAKDVANGAARGRRMEIYAFLIVTAILMPALAVATVGTWGLTVWIYQAINGPPGPPSK